MHFENDMWTYQTMDLFWSHAKKHKYTKHLEVSGEKVEEF